MVTGHQLKLTEGLQQAWVGLREEITLIEDTKVKDKLLVQVDKCPHLASLLYLAPMQDAFAEILIQLAQLSGINATLLEKIRQVKSLLDELNFTFTQQDDKGS